jgi:hypothetical protein
LPDELLREAKDAGWPEGLVERLGRLHFTPEVIRDNWLRSQPVERSIRGVEILERLAYGTLRLRDATYMPKDFTALVDLFANSPEDIGEWEVTVERGPDPAAQFSLQQNHRIRVLEDRGLFIGAYALSVKETFVGGRPINVNYMSGFRVRTGFRGQGLSQLLSWMPPAIGTPYTQGQWFYIRSQNLASVQWMNALNPDFLASAPQREDDVPGIEVFVLQYSSRPYDGDATGIRKVAAEDLEACVELINRTHDGLDLFTPFTVDDLRFQLDERLRGRRPNWWGQFYGWPNFYVLEEEGRIVACAGLWDKGANVRERWRLKSTGDSKLIDTTALIDFGFAGGHEDAMARLISYLIGETARLGRGYLVAPLQYLPEVAGRLEHYEPIPERRGLLWRTFGDNFEQMPEPDPPMTRPFSDLRYW